MSETKSDAALIGRRSFLWASAAAAAIPILTEADLANAKLASHTLGVLPPDAVIINANENPLGPCTAAKDAIANILAVSGRYDRTGQGDALAAEFAALNGIKPEN